MLSKKMRSQILDGALEDKKTYAAGTYRGFWVVMELGFQPRNCWRIQIAAHREDDTYTADLQNLLGNMKQENRKLLSVEVSSGAVTLLVERSGGEGKQIEQINSLTRQTVDFLASRYDRSGCMVCGAENGEMYNVNGHHVLLCPDCAEKVRQDLEDGKVEARSAKSKLLPGLVGAILGALVGGVAWVLIYKLGYIAGLAGLLIAVLSMKGYEKLGGAMDVKGVILSLIVMLGTIFLANKLAWAWEAYDALKEYDFTFFECYQYLEEILSDSELTGAYIKDAVIGVFLTLISCFGTIRSAFRTSSGSYTMKKEK